jgi:DNA helicase-2/ATP-dependent DNA helicase PcrA
VLRSTTVLGGPFEEALRALGLAYEVRGSGAIARNEVVRFLVGYLESLRTPDDPDAFEGALASSLGGVGSATLSRLRAHAREESRPLTRVVRRLMYVLAAQDPIRYPLPWGGEAPSEVSSAPDYSSTRRRQARQPAHRDGRASPPAWPGVAAAAGGPCIFGPHRRRRHRAASSIFDLAPDQRAEAIADLRAAVEGLERIEVVHERLHGARPLLGDITGSLDTLLAAAADDTEPPAQGSSTDSRHDAVQVLTVHQAKGLEFEVVFCAGFAHGLFPVAARPHPLLEAADREWLERFKVGFMPSWPSDPDGHMAEEARLAFVAMTRARASRLHHVRGCIPAAGRSILVPRPGGSGG